MRLSVRLAGLFPLFPAFLSLPAFSIPPLQNLHAQNKHGAAVSKQYPLTFTPPGHCHMFYLQTSANRQTDTTGIPPLQYLVLWAQVGPLPRPYGGTVRLS